MGVHANRVWGDHGHECVWPFWFEPLPVPVSLFVAMASRVGSGRGAAWVPGAPVRLMSAVSGEPLMLPGVSRAPEYTVPGRWAGAGMVEQGVYLMKLEYSDGALRVAVDEAGERVVLGPVCGFLVGSELRRYGSLGGMADGRGVVRVLFGPLPVMEVFEQVPHANLDGVRTPESASWDGDVSEVGLGVARVVPTAEFSEDDLDAWDSGEGESLAPSLQSSPSGVDVEGGQVVAPAAPGAVPGGGWLSGGLWLWAVVVGVAAAAWVRWAVSAKRRLQ